MDTSDLSRYNSATTPVFSFDGARLVARLLDVHDGDTVTVAAEVTPGRVCQLSLRLIGIDAPEVSVPAQRERAQAARYRLVDLLTGLHADSSRCLTRGEMRSLLQCDVNVVHVECGRNDKYGRVLARVSREAGGRHAGEVLLEEGLAYSYSGGTKELFKKAPAK
jgi:endonuclease YncB( thermonuclease family)